MSLLLLLLLLLVVVVKVKVKQSLFRLGRPWGFQEAEAPRFHDNLHMKVVRLSALRTGYLYLQEILLVLILGGGGCGDELFWTTVRMQLMLYRRRHCCKVQTVALEGIQGGMFSILTFLSARGVTNPQRIHRFDTHNAAHKLEVHTRALFTL